MTAIAPAGFITPPVIAAPPPILPPTSPTDGALPSPLMEGVEPRDALSVLLMSMERSGRLSIAATEDKIKATREGINEQLNEYLDKLREAVEAAKEHEDDGGFFGSIVSCVANVVGSIVGAVADVLYDYVAFPVEAGLDIAKNLNNPGAMMAALQSDLVDFGRTGEAGKAVKGFTTGVTKFAADLAAFGAKLTIALGKAGVTGGEVWNAVKDEALRLVNSLDKNIIANPDFWTVVGAAAKVAAVAGAVASAGALSFVCLGLLALSELDKQTNIIEKTVGKEAAPWVRVGVQVATIVAGAGAGLTETASSGSKLLRTIDSATKITQGAGVIGRGIHNKLEADRQGDQLDRQAEITTTLNRMQQMQRLCEELLDTLKDKNEDHTTDQKLGSDVVQAQAAGDAAVVMRA